MIFNLKISIYNNKKMGKKKVKNRNCHGSTHDVILSNLYEGGANPMQNESNHVLPFSMSEFISQVVKY